MNWTTIFQDAVPSVAGVRVYDKGSRDSLGRYIIAKSMELANGQFRVSQSYTVQRGAALRKAKKFLALRAKKAGLLYVIGDGARTLGYGPTITGEVVGSEA